ncbi:ABC transporter ATP-binding protein [Solwaraspora sp. WMMD1047]|uniref:ATP-binding cassette domain-containing protein n=1 Tax=Solwaraspora sp. WMMD1047 TaxID=3016102 RepID=UPI002416E1DF|nr:ABC transporter ATP-binding protein [Solwaraspora sp. WMMD1047]MDG4832102.1 ABC transporter ATP-binding protein [Solwaraspora sp. WMMD1047]
MTAPAGPQRVNRRAVARIAGWSVLESLPDLLFGLLIAAAIDHGFGAGRVGLGLALIGLLGLAQLTAGLATRAVFPWLAAVVEPLRDRLLAGVVAGSLRSAVLGQPVDTAVVAQVTTQVDTARGLASALLRGLRQGVLSLVAAVAGLALLAPGLGALVGGCLVGAALVFAAVVRRLRARQLDALAAEESLTEVGGRLFGAVRDITANNAADRARGELFAAIDRQTAATAAMARTAAGRTAAVAVGGYLPLLLLLLVIPGQLRAGTLSAGAAVGAVSYVAARLLPALITLTATIGPWLVQLAVVLARLRDAGRTAVPPAGPPAPPGAVALPGPPAHPGAVAPVSGATSVTLHEVTFRYGRAAAPVLDRFSLRLVPGDHLAVVGPSGVGKSTLTRLITGELPAGSGRVEFAGIDVGRLPPQLRRRELAVIPQQAYVFDGTLRDNLCYLSGPRPAPALDDACRLLGLSPLVDRLGGYDAAVGPGGAALSEGERQLVALVRAYLTPATVVVLDEATSHLDPRTEDRVERAFADRGGVLVVVAHRISSARRAGRILLLGEATPLLGGHDRLVAESPLYAELVGHWLPPAGLSGTRVAGGAPGTLRP